MRDNIFKEIIMDSPIAYVSVRGIRDIENKYADLKIIETNQAFLNISSSINKDIHGMGETKGLDIKSLNKNNTILKLINKHFIENSSGEKLTYDTYDKVSNKHYNIDIYKSENDTFWIKIIETTKEMFISENLHENEDKFKDIMSYSEEGFFIIENEEITYTSPSFSKIFGNKKERIFDYISNLDKYNNKSENDIKLYLKSTIDEVINIIDEDGKSKWIWLKVVPIKDERSNIIKNIGIIIDISKNKEAELKIEQMRNEFFANLSHELRTPINLILGTMQLIDLKLDRLDSKEKNYIKKYNKIITQNGLRLLKLVNNVIDTTRIDSGYFKYNPQNYDIISFVENICMSVCDFAKQHDIELIFDTELEENIMTFDLDMMERIILNLLSNAIKFNKEDGKIEVYISSDDIGNLNISVKDSGRGIPKDKVDNIFSRFNQVDSKSKQEKEGSGIGLSLVKSLIDLHNGNIYVNSELDKGTEFIISIPNVIIESDMEYKIIESDFESQVNRMNVEFSDIYA